MISTHLSTPIMINKPRISVSGVTPAKPARHMSIARAAPAKILYEATGVPLVDEMLLLPTINDAALLSVKNIATTAVLVGAAALVLKALDSALGDSSTFIADVTCSLSRPSQVVLPYYWLLESSKVGGALAQAYATKAMPEFNALCFGNGEQVLRCLQMTTQFLQDTSELALIVFVAWAVNSLKDRLVHRFLASTGSAEGIGRLIKPISQALTYIIGLAAVMAALSAYGINIQPLLASLGASSVVIGIASQNLLSNVGSGLSLYLNQPFIAGDKVKLLNGGSVVIDGTVVRIEPMRTVFRSKEGTPIFISNSAVLGYWVQNDSKRI